MSKDTIKDERRFKFELTGITPLLMHADDVSQADRLEKWRKDPANKGMSKAGDDRSPPWTWCTYVYNDGKNIAVPSDNIMAALRHAGAQMILKKQKTFKSATQCGIVLDQLFLNILVPHGPDGVVVPGNAECGGVPEDAVWKPIPNSAIEEVARKKDFSDHEAISIAMGFELFVKRAPVGQSKHVRVRPRFNNWKIVGTLVVGMDEISNDVLAKLFELAGNFAGLCDWRPSSPKSPGSFGRFETTLTPVE